ncbi:hypothetical protein COS75_03085 [Candidatus Pacearchaeota archaeon CG06_land_8_20_14_3_00_35_12]|nr:MAG: hypothetical protein COS75_03085 [Candidatus Pacearchaeota archaeon CG06_land_8_20_14_3_00_35_12]
MIIKNDLLKKIRNQFNLNIYETKVWIALLSRGIATAGEIAEMSGVPRSRTYDVLEGLEKQGFAVIKIGKPVKYIAVKPEIVLERLKQNISREAEEKTDLLANMKDTAEYKELALLHKQGIIPIKTEDLSGVINGRSNFYAFLQSMINDAEKEMIVIAPAATLTKKMKILKQIKDIKKKGVTIKVGINSENDAEDMNILEKEISGIKRLGIDGRFIITDRKKILFMIAPENPDEDRDKGIWINSEFFGSALSRLFDIAWQGK